jgi:hypothetical protein
MTEVLTFVINRDEINIYTLPVPPVGTEEAPPMVIGNSNAVVYTGAGIPSGIFRTNVSIGQNIDETQLTSGLMTITLNDEYKSFLSWNITFDTLTGRFPPFAKYILTSSNGSGIFLKESYIVMDITPNLIKIYVKFI